MSLNAFISRKLLFTMVVLASASNMAAAQAAGTTVPAGAGDRVTVKFTDPSRPGTVKAHLLNGGITVRGYSGTEVVIEARVRSDENHEGDHEGSAHRILMGTTGLEVEEENNVMNIGADSTTRTVDLTIQVPVRTQLDLKTVNDGDVNVTGVDGEIDVDDVNGEVTLSGVSGAAVAHALNGKVLATFRRIDSKPMAFSSLNGDIDVTFPADLRATVSFSADHGDVFSDFNIQLSPSGPHQIVEDNRQHGGAYRVRVDKMVHGTINGGGPEIQFKNFNGNIYIRRAGAK